MAPLTWKLLLATLASGQHCHQSEHQSEPASACQSESCEDQTALLQSHLASHKSQLGTQAEMLNFPKITSLTDPSKRKMALAQFENTALELAENKAGVTPLVVQVCNETSELLRDTVMSAIISEHDTDVAMLATAFSAFDGAEAARASYEAMINQAVQAVYGPGGLIEQHISCRTTESQSCVDCGTCVIECRTTTETCDLLEAELRLKYVDVINTVTTPAYCDEHGNIHPPQAETIVTLTDHHLNKEKMEAYIAALAAFEACEETETEHCSHCPDPPTTCEPYEPENCLCLNHTQVRTQCNRIQQSLQHAQCESRHTVAGYLTLYQQAFQGALHRYTLVETQIRVMEADRKVEWDTLERVICLLMTLSNDEDGSAASDATATAIEECREKDVDTSHLDIVYPVPPNMGDLPDLPHSPCSDEFEADAYTGVPEPCADNEELKQEFEHGLIADCTCTAEAPTFPEEGFPYQLGPYLLFDTGVQLNDLGAAMTNGFKLSDNLAQWEATFEGTSYNGVLSPFKDVTLPGVDEAFDLEEGTVSKLAWVYPDRDTYYQTYASDADSFAGLEETMTHRFFRNGGFAYIDADNTVVALKELSEAAAALTVPEDAQLTMTFDAPQGITPDQAQHACPGGFKPVTASTLLNAGAQEYCWDKSGTLSFCPHGCFTFTLPGLSGLGYVAFPLMASTPHLMPNHYAPTDQQGATVASMITGVLAATNPPSEEED